MRKTIIDTGWKKIFKSSLGRTRAIRVADGVKRLMTVAILSCVTTTGWAEESKADRRIDFNIPQQRADLALTEFAEQADLTLAVPRELLSGKAANALIGSYTLQEGVDILLAGTGLIPEFSNQIVLSIRTDPKSVGEGKAMKSPKKATGLGALLASVFAGGVSAEELGTTNRDGEGFPEELEEIIVTGTNIRGVYGASPVATYTREDIDLTGVSNLPDFIQTLPQNFGGGIAENTFLVDPSGNNNINSGTGVNLRGLGNDSTLVLLNGRRLAPAGFGDFVDISLIPLAAIETVEVLTDGASAIYGSDAVGGVVNFKLRTDFDGAETRVRYGTATDGDLDEIQVGQVFGKSWSDGYALISYEYQQRDSLDTNDRDFTLDADDPLDLLPAQERHSVFFSGNQSLMETFEIFADAFYSTRESESLGTNSASLPLVTTRDTEQYGGALGIRAALGADWQGELVGTFSETDVAGESVVLETGFLRDLNARKSTTWTIDGKVDGALIDAPGGEVKLAVGGQFRHEKNRNTRSGSTFLIGDDRDVYAIFGELFFPVIGEDNRMPGVERLELTVAGRYEDYSDFGSSTDKKFGVLWSPIEGLNLRATRGTSFRAPLFSEIDESVLQGFLISLPNPAAATGSALSVIARGNNADLQPETAATWTAGFDFQLTSLPGLDIQATYFDISFEDRISSTIALFSALTDPRFAPILDLDPDPDFLTFLGSLPGSGNFAPGFDFADAEVFVDERLRNQASVETKGFDFSASYGFDGDFGDLGFTVGGTYLFSQEERVLPTDNPLDLVDTAFNPIDLRLRSSVNWSYEGLSANLIVSYVDDYINNQIDSAETVESWTTADLIATYNTGDNFVNAMLDNTVFSINVLNVFDEDPPFIDSAFGNGINYDSTNASPIGRTIALQVTKNW